MLDQCAYFLWAESYLSLSMNKLYISTTGSLFQQGNEHVKNLIAHRENISQIILFTFTIQCMLQLNVFLAYNFSKKSSFYP